jgi:hypothetical protein
MVARVIWSGWLLWSVGCLICVLSRYNTFRLSVNMYARSFGYSVLMILNVLCPIIFARNMFWCPCSLLEMLRPLGLYIPYPVLSLLHSPGLISLGVIKEL